MFECVGEGFVFVCVCVLITTLLMIPINVIASRPQPQPQHHRQRSEATNSSKLHLRCSVALFLSRENLFSIIVKGTHLISRLMKLLDLINIKTMAEIFYAIRDQICPVVCRIMSSLLSFDFHLRQAMKGMPD